MHPSVPIRFVFAITLIAGVASTASVAQPAAAPQKTRIYLATFEHDAKVKPEAELIESRIAETIGAEQTFSLLSEKELRATLDQAALADALLCQEADCVVKTMGHTRALDAFVAGTVSRRANVIVVTAVMIAPKTGDVMSRRSLVVESLTALKKEAGPFAQSLVLGRDGGDRPLADLRIGVVIDEQSANGQPRAARNIQACASDVLSEADAILVSPNALARIQARGVGASNTDGIDALVTADASAVDVLLLGTAVWSDATPRGKIFGGVSVVNQQVDLGWQLVSVESGEVLASKSMAAAGVGHAAPRAETKARTSLCAALAPELTARLKKKVARGHRFVVEASGVKDPRAAKTLLGQIQAVKRIVRARVRNVNAGVASYDVWIAGGDGLTFADRATPLAPQMQSISRDRVTLTIP